MLNGEASSVFGPLKLKMSLLFFLGQIFLSEEVPYTECMYGALGERKTMPFSKVSLKPITVTSETQEATTSYPSRSAKD